MMNKTHGKLCCLLYAGVFLCFAAMFFFIVPQSDVLLFAHDPRADASGVLQAAFTYGNGRLLGNWVGMFFAHRFLWAFLPLAFCLTGIVWCVNRLVFDGSPKSVFPVACLLAFPSARMAEECYFLFAAFANYVLPIFFILLSACLVRALSRKNTRVFARVILYLILFVCAVLSALCSENTTIVFAAFAVLAVVVEAKRKKRVSLPRLVLLLGAVAGAAGMALVPVASGSAHNMDAYRGVAADSVSVLLRNVFSAFLQFGGIVHSLTPVLALLSGLFLLILRGKGNRPAFVFARIVLVLCPLLSFSLTALDQSFVYVGYTQAVCAVSLLLYAAAIWIGVSVLPQPKRTRARAYGLLLALSVAPLLLVTQHGYRTYYLTFILLLVWALELLRDTSPLWLPVLRRNGLRVKICSAACACALVFLSAFAGTQTMLNFDFFAARTAVIADAAAQGADEVAVPYLPYYTLSTEENWPQKISDVLPDKSLLVIRETTDYTVCDHAEVYEKLDGGSPFYALRYAFSHLDYKTPCKVHSALTSK